MMTSLPLLTTLIGLLFALTACKPDEKPPEPGKEKSASTPAPQPEPAKEKEKVPAKSTDPADAASYVGMSLEEAKTRADQAGIANRVVEQDGEKMMVTQDHRPERLNFAVKDGKIIRVTKG